MKRMGGVVLAADLPYDEMKSLSSKLARSSRGFSEHVGASVADSRRQPSDLQNLAIERRSTGAPEHWPGGPRDRTISLA